MTHPEAGRLSPEVINVHHQYTDTFVECCFIIIYLLGDTLKTTPVEYAG